MPQVKVIFEAEREIRRFLLPSSGAYEDLVGKINTVVGKDVNFRLFWKDAEGDFVVCDSDEELQTALDFLATTGSQSDLLRLYVRLTSTGRSGFSSSSRTAAAKSIFDEVTVEDDMDTTQETEFPVGHAGTESEEKKKEEPTGPKEHVGISCDGCGGQVIGQRFKCTKCPDYDICENCKGKGFHLEHEMETITEPRAREGFMGFPFMNMNFAGGCHRGGPRFHGRGEHGHGHGEHGHGHGEHGHGRGGHGRGGHGNGGHGRGGHGRGGHGHGGHGHGGHGHGGHGHGGHGHGYFPGMEGFMRQQHGPGGMFQSQSQGCGPNAAGGAGRPEGCCRGPSVQPPKSVDEIAKTLEEMGIKADGGVIRELIEQFHGDIVKVIEAMN